MKKQILVFLSMLLCFGFTLSVKATDVTISTPRNFSGVGGLDGSADDADGLVNGVFTVNGNLTIAAGGSINCNDVPGPGNDACPVKIVVSGDMEILAGGAIFAENRFVDGSGGDITITVGGIFTMQSPSAPYAGGVISSSNLSATSGKINAGAITINVTGNVFTGSGSTIKANSYKGKGGDIVVAGKKNVDIDGNVLSQSTGTGTGNNPGHGGMIFITAVNDLHINDNAVVSSRGLDPGADLVHLCGCTVRIWGLVESTGHGHAVPSNPPNHLDNTFRPDKPATSTGGIEVWGASGIVIDNLTHNGQLNADLSLGAGGKSWIDIFGLKNISIIGKTTGTAYAVHANVGGSGGEGGTITVKSFEGSVTGSGMVIQANSVGSNFRKGGSVTIHSKNDLNLVGAKMQAMGANLGGTVALRAFGTLPGSGNINMNATTNINVAINGAVTETACGAVGAATINGTAAAVVPVTGVCGGAPEFVANQDYVVFCNCDPEEEPCLTAPDCTGEPVVVDQNVTIDFNQANPANYYQGDPDLKPYFTYDVSGATPDTWKAIFNMGTHKLTVNSGFTIKTALVGGGYAPGIVINSKCDVEVQDGGHISVISRQKNAGDIVIDVNGFVTVNGEVRDEVTGTIGLPGAISIKSRSGITIGVTGRVFDFGIDGGGNLITLLTCPACTNHPDIIVNGLVEAYAHAHANDLDATRPRIRVVAIDGAVTVNANTLEPLLDEFSINGSLYDIYGGLLSWVRDNKKPGSVLVQAKGDITVNGHGTDPTGPVRTSFGAIAAIATASSAPGGLVDVRSLEGNITGVNRAFDVSGRNRLTVNYAHINLAAKANIALSNTLPTGNPVVDASGRGTGDKGGRNTLRSWSGGITIGTNALVSAAVPLGGGSVQGTNLLASCTGITNNGTVNPADAVPGDDIALCAPVAPDPMFINCNLDPFTQQAGRYVSNSSNNPVVEFAAPGQVMGAVKNGLYAYPNPFTNTTSVNYTLAKTANVTLEVYNALGKKITVLANGKQAAGTYHIQWNATGLPGGSYYIHLAAGTDAGITKIYLMR